MVDRPHRRFIFGQGVPFCPMAPRSRSGRGKGRKAAKSSSRKIPKLTPRQERLATALSTAPTKVQAALDAGYSKSTAYSGSSWWRRIHEKLRPVALATFAKHGKVTFPRMARKLDRFLEAEKVVLVRQEGEDGTVPVTVPDYGVQLDAYKHYWDRIVGFGSRVAGDVPEELETGQAPQIHFHFPDSVKRKGDGKADGRFRIQLEK